ncbi:MAG TPA: hypothetical protein VGF60_03215 [Xanthobacteraceae bacterium]|jgi:hypothetical protein
MPPVLRLYEDILSDDATLSLAPLPRMIFVVHGAVSIADQAYGDEQVWHGEGAVALKGGKSGATCWRWELASSLATDNPAAGRTCRAKLSAQLATLPKGELLLRGDSVAFPPGGCAYLHRHQGPGIRCLIEGGIRIDTHGRSTSYGPGGAWHESGPDAVFAQATANRPSRFIRVMILPRELMGKSSLQLLNEADKAKPRVQQYRIFVDAPITRPSEP